MLWGILLTRLWYINFVDGQMTFCQFLKQFGAGFSSASLDPDVPFSHLVRVLRNENKIERSNLFSGSPELPRSPSFATKKQFD